MSRTTSRRPEPHQKGLHWEPHQTELSWTEPRQVAGARLLRRRGTGELISSPWPSGRDQPVQVRLGQLCTRPPAWWWGIQPPLWPRATSLPSWARTGLLLPVTPVVCPDPQNQSTTAQVIPRLPATPRGCAGGPCPVGGTRGQACSAGTRVPAPAPGAERGQALVCLHVSASREKSCHISRTLSPEPHYSEMSLQLRTSLCRNICFRVTARDGGRGLLLGGASERAQGGAETRGPEWG